MSEKTEENKIESHEVIVNILGPVPNWCEGELIRCRNCDFSRIHDGKSYPGKNYAGKMYCIAWSDGYFGEWTKPDGHCHKAKKKANAQNEEDGYNG